MPRSPHGQQRHGQRKDANADLNGATDAGASNDRREEDVAGGHHEEEGRVEERHVLGIGEPEDGAPGVEYTSDCKRPSATRPPGMNHGHRARALSHGARRYVTARGSCRHVALDVRLC